VTASEAPPTPASQNSQNEASPAVVLREVSGMLTQVLGEYGFGEDVEITTATRFLDDLGLESIDLVVLGGHLQARYGDRINFAEFIADLELDEIIGLCVGQLVDYITGCLHETRSHPGTSNTASGEH
jgi:acyl carrier protein